MKKNGRKSSNIVDATSKAGFKKQDIDLKSLENPRLRLNEPVAWNQDLSDGEKYLSKVANPGRTGSKWPDAMLKSPGERRKMKDPKASKMTKDKSYYENIPDFKFFKHTIKEK